MNIYIIHVRKERGKEGGKGGGGEIKFQGMRSFANTSWPCFVAWYAADTPPMPAPIEQEVREGKRLQRQGGCWRKLAAK
jgi:hypothetical protein